MSNCLICLSVSKASGFVVYVGPIFSFTFHIIVYSILYIDAFLPLRSDLLVKVEDITENINVRRMEKKVIFTYLLTNSSIAPLIARYLTRAMGLRDCLIENTNGHV